MTNFEWLNSRAISELVDWLDKYGQSDDAPWAIWFNKTYCSKCEPIECIVDEKDAFFPGHTVDCAYCELEHKCKHFSELKDIPDNRTVIEMWLNEEENPQWTLSSEASPRLEELPMRTGKWIPVSQKPGVYAGMKCSICKAKISYKDYYGGQHNYCHKCGAKMIKEEDYE